MKNSVYKFKKTAGLSVGVILFTVLTGCVTTATVSMFPTEGPLKNARPAPVLTAIAENIVSNSGPFKVTYPDGDICEGRWSSIAPQMVSVGWGSLLGQYSSVAGVSATVANKPGINRGEAMAVCKSGNQVQIEFFTGSGTANGLGVAKDENGNIFKVLF